MQARIHARSIAGLTLRSNAQRVIKEGQRTSFCLFLISFLQGIRKFKESFQTAALAYDKIAQVRRQCSHEMERIESFCKYLIKCDQCRRIISPKESIYQREAIFIIKDIEIAEHILIFHIRTAERHSLVKDSKGVTHGAVSLMRDYMKRLIIDGHTLAGSYHTQVLHDVFDSDSVEIICLATRQDSRKDLMLLSCGQNEDSVCRRFLQSLEECIERSL